MNRIAVVSGRGYGKTLLMTNLANPEAPTVEELANATPLEGVTHTDISFGPVDINEPVYSHTNYEAQMSFTTEYALSHEQMRKMFHSMSFRRGVLGEFSMDYTPAEELRDRLNDWLQGKQPVAAINTRYWRGL